MDNEQWIDEEDLAITASLCRGREPQADTRVCKGSFTARQLDAIAPLSQIDMLSIRLGTPTIHARMQIHRRIEAACSLKYRTDQC